MPRLVNETPKYRKHRASGQAVVTVCGKDHYLGPYGTKASKAEYDRLVGEWLAAGRPTYAIKPTSDATINELALLYWRHVKTHYVKNGRPTSQQSVIRGAMKRLTEIYGHTRAVEFGPIALKAVRQRFIDDGFTRRGANRASKIIRRFFRWAASEELIPESIPVALATVDALLKGRTKAREHEPVQPVPSDAIEATLPHLPDTVADMVQLQRLTGMRPGELVIMRPQDIDRGSDVWKYTPESHKTEHHEQQRTVYIGPRAQPILAKYLLRDADSYCFAPAESEKLRSRRRREARRSPMTPSQAKRKCKARRSRRPGNRYTNDSYRRAIHRACDEAFPPPEPLARQQGETRAAWRERLSEQQRQSLAAWQAKHRWAPNQIRHSAATEIRAKFGIEAAQVTLGHSKVNTTEIYAAKNAALAAQVAREVG
jgi:integrase